MLSRTSSSKGRKLNDLLNSGSDSDTIGTPLRSNQSSRPGTPTVREENGSAHHMTVPAKRKRKILDSDSDSDCDNRAGSLVSPGTCNRSVTGACHIGATPTIPATTIGLAASTLKTPSATPTAQPSVLKPQRGKTRMCLGDLLDRGSGQKTVADVRTSTQFTGSTAPTSSSSKTTSSAFRTCPPNFAVPNAQFTAFCSEFPSKDETLSTAFVDDWMEDGIVTSKDNLLPEKKKRKPREKKSGEKRQKKEKKGKEKQGSIISSSEQSEKLRFLLGLDDEKLVPIPPRLPPLPAIGIKMLHIPSSNTPILVPEVIEASREICRTPAKSKRILPQSLLNNQPNVSEGNSSQSIPLTEVTGNISDGKKEIHGAVISSDKNIQSNLNNCKSFNTHEERMCAFNEFNEVKEYHLKKYKEGFNSTSDFSQKIKDNNLQEFVSASNIENTVLKSGFTDSEIEVIGDESAADAYFRCIKKSQKDVVVIDIADDHESYGMHEDDNDDSNQSETANNKIEKIINLHEESSIDAEIFTIDDSEEEDSDYNPNDSDDEDERKFMLVYNNYVRSTGR